MSFKTLQFRQLKDKWYKKLKNHKDEDYPDGFNDIEQDEERLKTWENTRFKNRYGVIRFYAQEKYYQLAEQFLNEYTFESKKDRTIWMHHSAGMDERSIAKKVRQKYGGNLNETIKRLRKEMLDRYNSEED